MSRPSEYPPCLCRPDASGHVQSRSAHTEARYRTRYAGMERTYCRRHGVDIVECYDLAAEVGHKSKNLSDDAITQYGSAIRQHLRDLWDDGGIGIEEIERIDALLREQKSLRRTSSAGMVGGKRKHKKRTSAGRTKGTTEIELMLLVSLLWQRPTPVRQIAAGLLEHSVQLVTRPSEFLEITEVEEGRFIVPSAKYSPQNRRGLAPYRVVPTDDYEAHDVLDLRIVIELIHQERAGGATTASLLRRCQHAIREARKGLIGRKTKIAPYSARHQARANLAASGASPEEIAVIMGHASAGTSQSHYAPARRAWKSMKGKPAPKVDSSMVRQVRPAHPSRGWTQHPDDDPKPE